MTELTSGDGIRAVRGTFILRVPSLSGKSRITPMSKNSLRRNLIASDASSGASFWVGLAERDSQGNLLQWVQTGTRWVQPQGFRFGSPPAFYLETGDLFNNLGAKSIAQVTNASAAESAMLGGGVVGQTTPAIANWHTGQLRYSFVLFKKPVGLNAENEDSSIEPWQLVIRDDRPANPTNSSFVHLSVSSPNTPTPVGDAARDELNRRYRAQKFRDLDALFETNQSITFAMGSSDQRASISGLQTSIGYSGQPDPMPNPNDTNGKVELFNWVLASFSWNAVTTNAGNLVKEIKTGKSAGDGSAEEGTTAHPDWSVGVPAGGNVEVWDGRSFVFE
jgi:hypothetical protein